MDAQPVTYEIFYEGKAVRCLMCDSVSYNENDVRNLYCSQCQQWHEDVWPPARAWAITTGRGKGGSDVARFTERLYYAHMSHTPVVQWRGHPITVKDVWPDVGQPPDFNRIRDRMIEVSGIRKGMPEP